MKSFCANYCKCRRCGGMHKYPCSNTPARSTSGATTSPTVLSPASLQGSFSSSTLSGAPLSPAAQSLLTTNETTLLGVDPDFLSHPRHKSALYNISAARNMAGGHAGDVSVVKWVRDSHVSSGCLHDHLSRSIRAADLAASITAAFLDTLEAQGSDMRGWRVRIARPTLIQTDERKVARRALTEAYIPHFRHFNHANGDVVTLLTDKKGRVDGLRTFHRLAQALTHFSLAWSQGEVLLCGLRGGVDEHARVLTLSDPVVHTWTAGQFGCEDNGLSGMRRAMRKHVCNSFCSMWEKPVPTSDAVGQVRRKKVLFEPVVDNRQPKGRDMQWWRR